MQRVLARARRSLRPSSISNLFNETASSSHASKFSFHTFSPHRSFLKSHKGSTSTPSDFVKWTSLGLCRTSKFASGFSPLQVKPLDSIMDVERAKHKSPDELALIWDDFHLGRGHIGATMKAKLYRLLEQRAADCQHFVIPLWRGSGYTTMFVQVKAPYMIFTGLEDYKARGPQASPYFTVSHYTDFADSKDLVLIRGDVVFTSKLSDSEANWLLEITQSFYLNDSRYKLVEQFNKQTRDFEFKDVLQALEMPSL